MEVQIKDLAAYIQNGATSNQTDPTKNGSGILASALTTSSKNYGNICPGPGHNAWMLTSTALVLMMTLPGLALFYGGMVRRKNVLSVCAQCFAITGLVTILWWLCGYGLVFGVNHGYCDPKSGNATVSPGSRTTCTRASS